MVCVCFHPKNYLKKTGCWWQTFAFSNNFAAILSTESIPRGVLLIPERHPTWYFAQGHGKLGRPQTNKTKEICSPWSSGVYLWPYLFLAVLCGRRSFPFEIVPFWGTFVRFRGCKPSIDGNSLWPFLGWWIHVTRTQRRIVTFNELGDKKITNWITWLGVSYNLPHLEVGHVGPTLFTKQPKKKQGKQGPRFFRLWPQTWGVVILFMTFSWGEVVIRDLDAGDG